MVLKFYRNISSNVLSLCNQSSLARPQHMANSVLLSIYRMQCVYTNPNHSPGLILVRAHKVTNVQKLPRWTPDTSYPVLQSRILEMVDQNDKKLNLKEDLSLGTRGVIQSTHLNSSVTWRPVDANSSTPVVYWREQFNASWREQFLCHRKEKKKVYISVGFQPKLGQFGTSLHNPPIGQRLFTLLKGSLEARLPSYI